MAENILEVRHLKKWFKIGNPAIKKVGVSYLHACDDVSFEIRKGDIWHYRRERIRKINDRQMRS
jgi:ABC-type oligopeptide transport system ATPase subunit